LLVNPNQKFKSIQEAYEYVLEGPEPDGHVSPVEAFFVALFTGMSVMWAIEPKPTTAEMAAIMGLWALHFPEDVEELLMEEAKEHGYDS